MHRISVFLARFAMLSLLSTLFLAGCGDAIKTTDLTITDFTPKFGPVTTTNVTITGTGFDATAANNTVKFNGTTAIPASATSTSITVPVPSGATTGPISVTVGGQTVSTTSSFTVTPIIITSSTTGITVTITGTGFDATTQGINTVSFNGTSATTVIVNSSTSITATFFSAVTKGGSIIVTVNGQASAAFVVP